jgi:hypothetical protein
LKNNFKKYSFTAQKAAYTSHRFPYPHYSYHYYRNNGYFSTLYLGSIKEKTSKGLKSNHNKNPTLRKVCEELLKFGIDYKIITSGLRSSRIRTIIQCINISWVALSFSNSLSTLDDHHFVVEGGPCKEYSTVRNLILKLCASN